MRIIASIQIEGNNESFRVTSQPHETVIAAITEIVSIAETQRILFIGR